MGLQEFNILKLKVDSLSKNFFLMKEYAVKTMNTYFPTPMSEEEEVTFLEALANLQDSVGDFKNYVIDINNQLKKSEHQIANTCKALGKLKNEVMLLQEENINLREKITKLEKH